MHSNESWLCFFPVPALMLVSKPFEPYPLIHPKKFLYSCEKYLLTALRLSSNAGNFLSNLTWESIWRQQSRWWCRFVLAINILGHAVNPMKSINYLEKSICASFRQSSYVRIYSSRIHNLVLCILVCVLVPSVLTF